MKTSSILLFFLLFAVVGHSTAQDSMKINASYLGVLYTGTYETTNWGITNAATLRGGVDGSFPLGSGFEFGFRAGAEMPTNLAFGKAQLSKTFGAVKVTTGYTARPITLIMRPMPLTPGGHFEPPSLAAMPGAGTGTMVSATNGIGTVHVGSFYLPATRSMEWHVAFAVSNPKFVDYKVALFTGQAKTGVAFSLERPEATITSYVASNGPSSLFLEARTRWCAPYFTVNYTGEVEHLEVGVTKTLQGLNGISGLIGAGWQHHSKTLNIYVQAYL